MSPYRSLPVVQRREVTRCENCRWDNSSLFGDDPWDCCGVRVGVYLGFGVEAGEPTRDEQSEGRCSYFTPTLWHRLMLLLRVRQREWRVDCEPALTLAECPVCHALPDQHCDAGLHS